MITPEDFTASLAAHGVDFVTGVPCSYFTGPIAQLTEQNRYVPAANEGAALAIAAGAAASGRRGAVLAQNSGFGNLINPLTSLLIPYDIPVLVFMTLRGWPDPGQDEPQHAVMGTSTHPMLDAMGVRHWTLRETSTVLDEVLTPAMAELAQGRPAFVLVQKGAIGSAKPCLPPDLAAEERLQRRDVMRLVLEGLPDARTVATTGYTARELFALGDADRNFYMQGSMGHAMAFGLGIALARPEQKHVVVFDGDGGALMHLGSMSTIGASAPANLVHVILDNGVYESTGAQPTRSTRVDFASLGRATGYRTHELCRTESELKAAVVRIAQEPGPHLLAVRTAPSVDAAPPRATSAVSAGDIHRRFTAVLGASAPWRAEGII
ncbi:thiamine pyrophosphate enzyme [Longimycelium tulufanense]|uniref:Thiamine pyrophosphate enzyme n=1 Tax=Longimycelium tulufanense TaxID=907463 RepID=A0A8J3CBF4_9PSEU|nr:phosphonopyruvate decarboxylase [Longimycelium tulufanense]GGM41582.1 thiamine pyrophosphate enzyme [Longimycelium tulufanense]